MTRKLFLGQSPGDGEAALQPTLFANSDLFPRSLARGCIRALHVFIDVFKSMRLRSIPLPSPITNSTLTVKNSHNCFWSKSSALGNTKTTEAEMRGQGME